MSVHHPPSTVLRFLPWLLLLAAIWGPVVYLLGAQWASYEQYNYGWVVPFLCVVLVFKRARSGGPEQDDKTTDYGTTDGERKTEGRHPVALVLLVVAGLVFWIMRVLQEANPIWRLASYGLAFAAVAMTLLSVYLTQGGKRAGQLVFPVAFFIVSVPWPTPVEQAIIQTLTHFNAGLVVEGLGLMGIPALVHGNVIEISAGLVGIDEACSGIRSFQATLMIALFFGGFYGLTWARRGWLLAAGPVLALAFNLARTLVLVGVAARSGLPAMERWHDSTGIALLVGCFLSVWAVALFFKEAESRKPNAEDGGQEQDYETTDYGTTDRGRKSEVRGQRSEVGGRRSVVCSPVVSGPVLKWLALSIAAWTVVVEASTEAWFRSHEARGDQAVSWVARWPVGAPAFHTNVIPQYAQRELRCDLNSSASWSDEAGVFWQAFFLRWLPADSFYGRAKVALSKGHNPAICLTGTGMKLEAQLDPVLLPAQPGLNLLFHRYVFAAEGRDLFVFFSQTEDMTDGSQASLRSTHLARLRAALAGSRNYGQNNFEVALTGPANSADALRLFAAHLPELVAVGKQ